MKLGLSYNLFDGEELLEYSIKPIRDSVDYISVVYQLVSNHGNPCSENLENLLLDLKNRGLIDEIVLYTPKIENWIHRERASINETEKRNIGLELSRSNGCTHHMTIDTDEFYTTEQFNYMKRVMFEGNFDSAVCNHCQYYKDSIYMLRNKEGEFVTTIQKINDYTKYVYKIDYFVPVDPTRKTNNQNCRVFSRNEVEMHHMSFVRKDIKKKMTNSSARRHFTEEQINKVDEHYRNWVYPMPGMWAGANLVDVVEVPRLFEIYNDI
jgi:hypothetical protein